jgi:hypothetical protein
MRTGRNRLVPRPSLPFHRDQLSRRHDGTARKIRGERVVQLYLATGPNDEDPVNDGPTASPLKHTLSRDLAVFELRHALPHHHGVAFSLDDLQVGQQVDISTYPEETIAPFGSLLQFHGAFKGQTTTGLLSFDYSLSACKTIHPGASGGTAVDAKTHHIVGILNAIARSGELTRPRLFPCRKTSASVSRGSIRLES